MFATVVATVMVSRRDESFRMLYELYLRKIENSCQKEKLFDVFHVYLCEQKKGEKKWQELRIARSLRIGLV